jgi:hypothetical protein
MRVEIDDRLVDVLVASCCRTFYWLTIVRAPPHLLRLFLATERLLSARFFDRERRAMRKFWARAASWLLRYTRGRPGRPEGLGIHAGSQPAAVSRAIVGDELHVWSALGHATNQGKVTARSPPFGTS